MSVWCLGKLGSRTEVFRCRLKSSTPLADVGVRDMHRTRARISNPSVMVVWFEVARVHEVQLFSDETSSFDYYRPLTSNQSTQSPRNEM